MERYLDSMRVVTNNDSVFYEEGGMYAEYQRYFNLHRHEASVTGYNTTINFINHN
jgi:hypothetical protein